jgi:hypothetical protein
MNIPAQSAGSDGETGPYARPALLPDVTAEADPGVSPDDDPPDEADGEFEPL